MRKAEPMRLKSSDDLLVIMVIVGTRPEVIKIAPIIIQMRCISEWKTVVVSTGQHRELVQQAISIFGNQITADVSLDVMTHNQQLSSLGASILLEVDKLIHDWRPHLLLVQGDTTTVHKSALAAFHRVVPVGHIEAGLRTYDTHHPFPEELNRQAVSNIASFHFAAKECAAMNLGRGRRHVYITGNTVLYAQQMVLEKLSRSPGSSLTVLQFMRHIEDRTRKLSVSHHSIVWCLSTMHRRENFGSSKENTLKAIVQLLEKNTNLVILFPVHPNPAVRAAISRVLLSRTVSALHNTVEQESRFFLVEPFGYTDLLYFMNMKHFVLTDSG